LEAESGLDPDLQDDGEFMLDTAVLHDDYGFPSSDDDADGPALRDFEYNAPPLDHVSDAGTAGAVGGGLRDEPVTTGRRQKKLSRHGIPVPFLPSGVVKRLATRFARTSTGAKTKISKDTLAAIEQASEWFFEQASQDLATYAKHAGRKTIDESDVGTLIRR
jgi:histone H3/H4